MQYHDTGTNNLFRWGWDGDKARTLSVQGPQIRLVPRGWVKFITALAQLFCLALLG